MRAMQNRPTVPRALRVKYPRGAAWPNAQALPGRRERATCGCVSSLVSLLLAFFPPIIRGRRHCSTIGGVKPSAL